MNFSEDALRRKRVMFHHVRVRDVVERIVRERQRLAREIAMAVIHAAIGDGFTKCSCVWSVIHGGGAAAEPPRVNRERAELRAHIEQPRHLIFWSVRQDVRQDSNLSPAVAQAIANPFREIRRDARVARNGFEDGFETIESGKRLGHRVAGGIVHDLRAGLRGSTGGNAPSYSHRC